MVPNMIAQTEFVEKTEAKTLFFVGDQLTATLKMPGELPEKQKIVYFLKFGEKLFRWTTLRPSYSPVNAWTILSVT